MLLRWRRWHLRELKMDRTSSPSQPLARPSVARQAAENSPITLGARTRPKGRRGPKRILETPQPRARRFRRLSGSPPHLPSPTRFYLSGKLCRRPCLEHPESASRMDEPSHGGFYARRRSFRSHNETNFLCPTRPHQLVDQRVFKPVPDQRAFRFRLRPHLCVERGLEAAQAYGLLVNIRARPSAVPALPVRLSLLAARLSRCLLRPSQTLVDPRNFVSLACRGSNSIVG